MKNSWIIPTFSWQSFQTCSNQLSNQTPVDRKSSQAQPKTQTENMEFQNAQKHIKQHFAMALCMPNAITSTRTASHWTLIRQAMAHSSCILYSAHLSCLPAGITLDAGSAGHSAIRSVAPLALSWKLLALLAALVGVQEDVAQAAQAATADAAPNAAAAAAKAETAAAPKAAAARAETAAAAAKAAAAQEDTAAAAAKAAAATAAAL